LPSWGYGYGYTYANPYYVESTMPAYDYSQPIVINNYDTSAAEGAPAAPAPPAESPETTEAYRLFDQALAVFKKGDYRAALPLVEQARAKAPNDPAMHEVTALCLFATGDYARAAAILNSLLAAAPGMDWTTLSGLYGNTADYTAQLRALETYCQQKPDDAAARFVLAYHYLVAGHDDAAAQLKLVVARQPEDQVAKRMLESLSPAEPASQPPATAQPAAAPAATPAAETGPTTDLVGVWRAERDGDAFELSIDAESKFAWKATPKGKPPVTLSGAVTTAGDAMLLASKDQGTMAAQVKSGGADQFQFIAAGSPPGDPGLSFQRVKQNP
jgi:tetratricopeptide (TPR) repeat protein